MAHLHVAVDRADVTVERDVHPEDQGSHGVMTGRRPRIHRSVVRVDAAP